MLTRSAVPGWTAACRSRTRARRSMVVGKEHGGNITMKRQLCSLVLTGLLATGVMLAQEPASAPDQQAPQADAGGMGGHRGGNMMDPDQRLAHMTKRYKLTADQQG